MSNSLLDTATFLRSLGRATDPAAFARPLETRAELTARGGMETMLGFGGEELCAVRHAAKFANAEVGGRGAPSGYTDSEARWL